MYLMHCRGLAGLQPPAKTPDTVLARSLESLRVAAITVLQVATGDVHCPPATVTTARSGGEGAGDAEKQE